MQPGRTVLGFYQPSLVCLALLLVLVGVSPGRAEDSSLEFWPETDLWYRLNPEWRLSAFVPFTKYYESKNRDLNVYLQADYVFGNTRRAVYRRLMDESKAGLMKAWLVRGGYMTGRSLGEAAGDYTEDMIFAELHNRAPLQGGFVVSSRLRFDARWLGDDAAYSYRLRYRAMLEKEFTSGRNSIVPYVNVEPFWDSRSEKVTRTRVIGGATLSRNSRFAYEANLTYQYDETYETTHVFALNLILHVFFDAKPVKTKP